MFKTSTLLFASLSLVALLAGCGQKGPLFMPTKPAQLTPTTPATPSAQAAHTTPAT